MAQTQPPNPADVILTNPVFRDMIHTETVRKELRRHTLYEEYKLTPNVAKRIVVTNKPNESRVAGNVTAELEGVNGVAGVAEKEKVEVEDAEYIQLLQKSRQPPSATYPLPVTSSQTYGWDTKPLVAHQRLDRRFYRPKVETEVTKMYGAAMIMKGDKKKKDEAGK
ncbi:hypothetical protein HDV00_004413 [Rhizophlyctis rosea]|nr:hypothetical protein HDV00_004413 [Rhizophlyctis rosea]